MTDHLGSTRYVVNSKDVDMEFRRDYYPFGEDYSSTGSVTDYKFTGKEHDESGFYYYGARYYDPRIGRFLTPDPLSGLTPNINPYHYCRNNPINRIDLFGLSDDDDDEYDPDDDPMTDRSFLIYVIGIIPSSSDGSGSAGGSVNNSNSNSNNSNIGIKAGNNYTFWASNALTASSTGLGVKQFSLVYNGMWKGLNGKWYSLKWGGNKFTGARSLVLGRVQLLKVTGRYIFFTGVAISGVQGILAFERGDYAQTGKSALDIGMGYLGIKGGPVGLTISGVYFIVDATCGWERVGDALSEVPLQGSWPAGVISPNYQPHKIK